MESILQFIYLGEAKCYKERMNEFLIVAKNLHILELANSIEDRHSTADSEDDTNIETEEPLIETDYKGDSRVLDIDEAAHVQQKTSCRAVTKGNKYECQQCDKAFTNTSHLTRHIQSTHEGVKYACNQCEQQFTAQKSLTTHIRSVHEGVKYGCNQCDKQFTQQSSLTSHIQSIHEGVKYACL